LINTDKTEREAEHWKSAPSSQNRRQKVFNRGVCICSGGLTL